MNKTLFAFLIMAPFLIYSQKRIQIEGNAPNIKDGTTISLTKVVPKFSDIGTNKIITTVKNQHFYFSNDIENTELYSIEILGEWNSFFLDKGKAEILIPDQSIKKAIVKNSVSESDLQRYMQITDNGERKEYSKALTAYDNYVLNKSNDVKVRDEILMNIDKTQKKYEQAKIKKDIDWINTNINSSINTYILHSLISLITDNEIAAIFNKLPDSLKNNSWGKVIKYKIDNLMVGSISPFFKQPDSLGNQISLLNFKGKYVLLDFWATWCKPCRAENPNLVKAMLAFRDKSFIIVSISLDNANKRKDWLDAIKNDKMDWINLSTLTGFNNEAALKYHITSIPSNFLISPDGKIIGKNLVGVELLNKLKELME